MGILPRHCGPAAASPGGRAGRRAACTVAAVLLAAAWSAAHAVTPPGSREVEGAVGSIVSWGPDYLGAASSSVSAVPAFYLRYKRLSVSNRAGFVSSRRPDDVLRGLGLDLLDDDDWRLQVGLRLDRGRRDDAQPAFRGLGDVPATLRLRLGLTRWLDDGWRVTGSWTVDAFGRGGGHLGDVAVVREWPMSPTVTVTASTMLTLGGRRYLRTYFGVDEAQSAASGHPVYVPGFGLRDLNATAGWRIQLGPHWAALVSVSGTRMLGPAADSPLVQRRAAVSASAGLAWRF